MLFHTCSTQCPVHCPHGEDGSAGGGTARRRKPTVDLHCHAFFPEVEKLVAGHPGKRAELEALAQAMGAETVRYNNAVMLPATAPKLTDLATRLRDMDAMGVDVQLVSPTSTQHCYWAEAGLADEIVRIQNEGIAELCATHPTRFLGLGTLALQDTGLALRQLEHAVRHLGLRGVEVSTLVDGRGLADPAFEPVWAKAQELGCIVFIHPFGTTLGTRLDRYYLQNVIGQPLETAITLSQLIFGGLFDRYPELKILAAHGGGYLPAYIGRSDHAWESRPDARTCLRKPRDYLGRIWFDHLVYEPESLRHLVAEAGAGQVVIGTDYPFDMGHYDIHRLLDAVPGLSDADKDAILYGNAERLLGVSLRAMGVPG